MPAPEQRGRSHRNHPGSQGPSQLQALSKQSEANGETQEQLLAESVLSISARHRAVGRAAHLEIDVLD